MIGRIFDRLMGVLLGVCLVGTLIHFGLMRTSTDLVLLCLMFYLVLDVADHIVGRNRD